MTNKQKIIKMCLFSLCLTLSAISFVMIWFKDTDLWEAMCLFLFLTFLVLSLVSLKYPKIDHCMIGNSIEKKFKDNPLPLDKVNKMYRYYGLESKELNILRLYFNEDYTKRCVFYQQSNGVKVKFEEIYYHSDESKYNLWKFASWYCYSDIGIDASGFYADCEIAYRESKDALKDFHEVKLDFQIKYQKTCKVIWKNWKVDSKELPYGERVLLDMCGNNRKYENVEVDIYDWFSEFYCRADIFIDASYEFDINKKCKFCLYKDGKKVGTILFNK